MGVSLGELSGRHPRFGVLYPCSGTRDADFWFFAPPGASVHITRLPFESDATAAAISAMSSEDNLRMAARLVAGVQPTVCVWADTSGSFLFGPDGDRIQCELLREVSGAPATTTATALVEACAALEVTEVDIASPYLGELNAALVQFLDSKGIEVGELKSLELGDSNAVASVPEEEQYSLVRSASQRAPAVLIPCTDFLTVSLIPRLEEELRKPIIAANPATMWHAVQLLGGYPNGFRAEMGRLFRVGSGVGA